MYSRFNATKYLELFLFLLDLLDEADGVHVFKKNNINVFDSTSVVGLFCPIPLAPSSQFHGFTTKASC